MKPGWKTTEFWMTLAASVVGFVYASGIVEATSTSWDDKVIGLVAMVLASMGYAVSRGIAKKTP